MISFILYMISTIDIVRRRPFTFAYSVFILFLIWIVYAVFPISYSFRWIWIPVIEEGLKAYCIYKFQKMRRIGRMLTSAAYGVVDGLSQLPKFYNAVSEGSIKLQIGDQLNYFELNVYPLLFCWTIVLGHFLIGALFMSPTKRNIYIFFIPPLLGHFALNFASQLITRN